MLINVAKKKEFDEEIITLNGVPYTVLKYNISIFI